MSNFSTKRFLLGVATVASEVTNPNAGAGTAAATGSMWLREGNGAGQPTQTYLNLDGDAKGWQIQNLVNLKVYNVRAFGALGNGVQDDSAAINAAVVSATASGVGGIVYFPPGTYRVARPASGVGSVNLSNVHDLVFLGDGFASQIAMIGSSLFGDWYMFRIRNGSSRIKFINLSVTSNITDKDPSEQNHFFNISGVAGDPNGGPHDIDVIGCYVGFIFGDGVRNLGEAGQVVRDVTVLYNDFSMTASRSCIEAQRSSDGINFSHNFCTGSQDQQIDFEPTAGDGPINWTIVGNHCDHSSSSSSAAITISGTGNTPATNANRRMILAFNTVTSGGVISGVKGVVGADILGNIVTVNQTVIPSASAPIAITDRVQNCNIVGNVCINQNAVNNRIGIQVISNVALNAPAEQIVISDNIVTTIGTNCQGIGISDTNNMLVSGNVIEVSTSVANVSAGINAVAANQTMNNLTSVGNMVFGITSQMKVGIGYGCAGFDMRNCIANYNYVRSSLAIIFFSRTLAEQFLDWRGVQGNNGVAVSAAPIQGPATFEGVTLDGNAGPGAQITLVQTAPGPEGKVTAPPGAVCLNTLGAQGTVLWMKETGVGVDGSKAGWVQQGAIELCMGAHDVGTGTAALFLAPGVGLALAGATEVQFVTTRAGTLRNPKIACVAGTGAGTVTYTLRRNGANTAVVVAVANTAATAAGTGSVNVGVGDRISVSVAKAAVVAAGQTEVAITFELTA